jgi:hypothetical protein
MAVDAVAEVGCLLRTWEHRVGMALVLMERESEAVG